MRCFACDMQVSEESLDIPTGRFYCKSCFEATVEEMLKQDLKEFGDQLKIMQGTGIPVDPLDYLVEDDITALTDMVSWDELRDREFAESGIEGFDE